MAMIVKIRKIEGGQAPPWVKNALIGLRVKADYPPTFVLMYDTAFVGNGLRDGYHVSQSEICRALIEANRPHAAQWFQSLWLCAGTVPIALSSEEAEFIGFDNSFGKNKVGV